MQHYEHRPGIIVWVSIRLIHWDSGRQFQGWAELRKWSHFYQTGYSPLALFFTNLMATTKALAYHDLYDVLWLTDWASLIYLSPNLWLWLLRGTLINRIPFSILQTHQAVRRAILAGAIKWCVVMLLVTHPEWVLKQLHEIPAEICLSGFRRHHICGKKCQTLTETKI